MPKLQQHPQAETGNEADRVKKRQEPQDVIRVYLDEHGPVRVPFRYLLATWRLANADPRMRAHMAAALAEAGINVSRPLLDIEPGDEIELSSSEAVPELDVGETLSALERAHEQYAAGFAEAAQRLAAAEGRYLDDVTRHCRRLEQAGCNRLVVSVGQRRPLRLHETTICSDNAEFILSYEVVARVASGTNVAELEIKAPGWRIFERFMLGVDIQDVQELRWFAAMVNVGAGRLSTTKDGMAERTIRALSELGPSIGSREEIERACKSVVAAAGASEGLDYARLTLAAALGSAPKRHLRITRRARSALAAARETIEDCQRQAAESAARVQRESHQAGEVSERLELPENLPALQLSA